MQLEAINSIKNATKNIYRRCELNSGSSVYLMIKLEPTVWSDESPEYCRISASTCSLKLRKKSGITEKMQLLLSRVNYFGSIKWLKKKLADMSSTLTQTISHMGGQIDPHIVNINTNYGIGTGSILTALRFSFSSPFSRGKLVTVSSKSGQVSANPSSSLHTLHRTLCSASSPALLRCRAIMWLSSGQRDTCSADDWCDQWSWQRVLFFNFGNMKFSSWKCSSCLYKWTSISIDIGDTGPVITLCWTETKVSHTLNFLHIWTHHAQTISCCLLHVWMSSDLICPEFMCERGSTVYIHPLNSLKVWFVYPPAADVLSSSHLMQN